VLVRLFELSRIESSRVKLLWTVAGLGIGWLRQCLDFAGVVMCWFCHSSRLELTRVKLPLVAWLVSKLRFDLELVAQLAGQLSIGCRACKPVCNVLRVELELVVLLHRRAVIS
jgi:hypothetical protein